MELKLFGPFHKYVTAMGDVAAPVSVSVAPLHNEDGEARAVTAKGIVFTVTDVVATVVLPQLLIADRVYIPAERVLTVTEAGFNVELKLLGPLQE